MTADAITPSCAGCVACCLSMGVPPMDHPADKFGDDFTEYENLPKVLRREIDQAWKRGPVSFVSQPCIWLDVETRRCRNYEHRPRICRNFPPGNFVCLEDRVIHGIDPKPV